MMMTHNVHSEYCPCVSLLLIYFFVYLEMILTLLLSFVFSISAGGEECGDVKLIKPLCDVLNSTIKMDPNGPSKCINNDNQGKWIKTDPFSVQVVRPTLQAH